MKIRQLEIHTSRLSEMTIFYEKVIGFQVQRKDSESALLSRGEARLELKMADHEQPFYHFAFSAPQKEFNLLAASVQSATSLLINECNERVMKSNLWKGDQIYFHDPDGNIVEILSPQSEKEFNIREVGLPSENIHDLKGFLREIPSEFQNDSDLFQFYGDQNGVFVLVHTDRKWYLTNKKASIHPISVTIEGEKDTTLNHPVLPYRIKVKQKI
ncbi:MAG: hypothetical protein H0Z32_10220 [Bacillaceae bacterium]|nr:hypothetical protein [Bacillaceae bacterium]